VVTTAVIGRVANYRRLQEYLVETDSSEMVSRPQLGSYISSDVSRDPKADLANAPTEPVEIAPMSPVEDIEELVERTSSGRGL